MERLKASSIPENKLLKTVFADEWLVHASHVCDHYYVLKGEIKTRTRSTSSKRRHSLAYCAYEVCEFGIVVHILATEAHARRTKAGTRILDEISRIENHKPIIAMALEGSVSFWMSCGFVKCDSKKIRAKVGGDTQDNMHLQAFVRIDNSKMQNRKAFKS